MRAVARGALLLSLLPSPPAALSAADLRRALAKRGVQIHVRSVQRDLESLPNTVVQRRGRAAWSAR